MISVKKAFWLFIFLGGCFEFQWLTAQEKKFKILIKMPTRSRPVEFFKCLDRYYSYLSGTVDCGFLISCDSDDQTMNCAAVIERLKKYKNLSFYFSPGVSKIEAYNRDIEKHLDFDVVVVTSDDLLPVMKNYDVVIRDHMVHYFSDTDGVLQFNDGNLTNNTRTNTYPIIGKKFYDRFGYVYHPFYKSLFCDDEITNVSLLLDKRMIFSDVLFVHVHPGVPLSKEHECDRHHWDALYDKNEQNQLYDRDGAIYFQRKAINFCLDLTTKSVIKLSLLVSRANPALNLYCIQQLQQYNLTHCVEILVDAGSDKTFRKNIRDLLQKSRGEYVWCIETEENLKNNNLATIFQKLRTYPDYVKISKSASVMSFSDVIRRDIMLQISFEKLANF